MKKMKCEVCGSLSIKKENGVFVCQECGTEYSTEEARKLLRDVDAIEEKQENNESMINDDAYVLYGKLLKWFEYCSVVESIATYPFVLTSGDEPKIEYSNDIADFRNNPSQWKSALSLRPHNRVEKLIKTIFDSFKEEISEYKELKVIWKEYNAFCSKMSHLGFVYNDAFQEPNSRSFIIKDNRYGYTKEFFNIIGAANLFSQFFSVGTCDYFIINLWDVESASFYHYKPGFFSVKHLPVYLTSINEAAKKAKLFREKMGDIFDDFANSFLPKALYEKNKFLQEFLKKQDELLQLFMLPKAYRNAEALCKMCILLKEGRASNWKELINLYKEEEFNNALLQKFNSMEDALVKLDEHLEEVSHHLVAIRGELSSINLSISDMRSSVIECNQNLKNISKYDFITMCSTL